MREHPTALSSVERFLRLHSFVEFTRFTVVKVHLRGKEFKHGHCRGVIRWRGVCHDSALVNAIKRRSAPFDLLFDIEGGDWIGPTWSTKQRGKKPGGNPGPEDSAQPGRALCGSYLFSPCLAMHYASRPFVEGIWGIPPAGGDGGGLGGAGCMSWPMGVNHLSRHLSRYNFR